MPNDNDSNNENNPPAEQGAQQTTQGQETRRAVNAIVEFSSGELI